MPTPENVPVVPNTAAEILRAMGLAEDAALAEAEVIALDAISRPSAPSEPQTAPAVPTNPRPLSFRATARLVAKALAVRIDLSAPALDRRYEER